MKLANEIDLDDCKRMSEYKVRILYKIYEIVDKIRMVNSFEMLILLYNADLIHSFIKY